MTFMRGDAPVFIISMMRSLGIIDYIDTVVDWDRKHCKMSPGTRLSALVANILISRQPLYHIADFYQHYDCELLFGKGRVPEDLTDDCFARMLDLLYNHGLKDIYAHLAFQIHQSLYGHNKLTNIHLDRTTVSLYGDYDDEPEHDGELRINFGFSKDHRADLKQYSVGLAVNEEGLPLLADIGDGNSAENPWYRSMLPQFEKVYPPEALTNLTAIADAAFVSGENLAQLQELGQGFRFISRLSAKFKAEKKAKEDALSERTLWVSLGAVAASKYGASYACSEQNVNIQGVMYRAIVYASSSLTKSKEESFRRAHEKERLALVKACEEASQTLFSCEADAIKRAKEVQAAHAKSTWTVTYHTESIQGKVIDFVPLPRGSKKELWTKDGRSIRLVFDAPAQDEAKAKQQRDYASLFVLITNIPKEEADAETILRSYKEQQAVEIGFRFLKGPLTLGPAYFKKESHVEAMAMVSLIALLVGMAIQIRVRRGVKARERKLDAGYRKTDAPTIKVILELFDWIPITMVDGQRSMGELRPAALEVLKDCGIDPSCWLTVPG